VKFLNELDCLKTYCARFKGFLPCRSCNLFGATIEWRITHCKIESVSSYLVVKDDDQIESDSRRTIMEKERPKDGPIGFIVRFRSINKFNAILKVVILYIFPRIRKRKFVNIWIKAVRVVECASSQSLTGCIHHPL